VSGPHGGRRSTWRHFGTDERITFLERAERDPAVGHTLRRRLRRVSRLGFLVLVVVAALELHRLWEARAEERLVADLCLGRYTAAAARLAGLDAADADRVDERLALLVELGASLPPEDRSPDALEALALRALEEERLPEAAALLELVVLRGRDDLDPALAALEARIEGSESPAGAPPTELPADLPGAWRDALGAQ